MQSSLVLGALTPKWGTLGRAQDRASDASRNDVRVRRPRLPTEYTKKNGIFANPVRRGCDQFVVQPHLQFCHVIELNLSQRP
jgi:hypothetical protein